MSDDETGGPYRGEGREFEFRHCGNRHGAERTPAVFFMNDLPEGVLSHDEVLKILSEQAKKGSVTAAAALERALRARAKETPPPEDDLDRILRK
jgi:hypothetical protein